MPAPQFAQLTAGMGLRSRNPRGRGIERAKRFRRAPSQGSDLRSVILVGNFPRAVVELELLQCGQSPVALFGKLQTLLLERVGLLEPVVRARYVRPPEEGQRHDNRGSSGEQGAERKPDTHARNARALWSGFGR